MAVSVSQPGLPAPHAGLLEAAVGPLELDVHAQADGLTYELDSCGAAHLYPAQCDTTWPTKVYDACEVVTAKPFVVYASLEAGALGTDFAEREAQVRRRLQAVEPRSVERAFWGGDGNVPGVLQDIGATDLGPSTDAIDAFAKLEQALADNYGLQGLIHVRPAAVARLAAEGLLRRESNGALYTWRGNRVVVGEGYAGVGPAGEAPTPGGEWMFATGRVVIWRSLEAQVPPVEQALDRTTNQIRLTAERTYVIGVECYAAATLVTLQGGTG